MLRSLKPTYSATLALAALAVAPAAQAQTTLPTRTTLLPTTGTREINVAGSLFLDGDKPYALSGTYGLFTSPSLEIGLTGDVAGANHSSTLTAVGGFADYYFRGGASAANPLIPYLGVFAGYSHKDDSNASLGGQVGAKYFFNPNVAASLEYQYRSTKHGNGTNEILLGFSTFFH
jgi:opacity protein-like surface antigen